MTEAAQTLAIFQGAADFVAGVADPAAMIPPSLPEIALIGRSNVGKSSLVNALTGRRDLARTSSTPGRTQQLNFFKIGGRFLLVDLPGYGHAQASKGRVRAWTDLVRDYMRTRPTLRRVLLLIDARHGALANDLDMMNFLDRAAVSYQIVLTKFDLLVRTERDQRFQQMTAMLPRHPAAAPTLLVTSAKDKAGIDDVRQAMIGMIES